LPDLEKNLSAAQLETWLGQLSGGSEVEVYLPRFKLNSRYDLGAPLQKLGMADAFTARADFSGMDGARDLSVGVVVHQAFVEVNEEGTEAAAATGVGMVLLAVQAAVPVFRADHPFLFLIRDVDSGMILFFGRFATPTE
jgi:serpin B